VQTSHHCYGSFFISANDKLVRLLFFLGALKDAAAGRVTAVAPYLCYARKDRRSKAHDPVCATLSASVPSIALTVRI